MKAIRHEFVDVIPNRLEEGVVYVSIKYASTAHKCCCGCGEEVNLPLSPTDWQLIFDGESISLFPSVGNWSLDCQSHYWIENNQVHFAKRWSRLRIEHGRQQDRWLKDLYYQRRTPKTDLED